MHTWIAFQSCNVTALKGKRKVIVLSCSKISSAGKIKEQWMARHNLKLSDISSAGKIMGQWLARHNLKLKFLGWVDLFRNDFYINFFS